MAFPKSTGKLLKRKYTLFSTVVEKVGCFKNSKKYFSPVLLKVAYFSLLVFVLETTFFHIFNYIHNYFNAVLIISYAVLGIGLGAFVSSKIKIKEDYLFIICSLGTILSLYLAIVKAVFFASSGISNFILSLVFLFPAVYISKAYVDYKSSQIYLFDMLGCFLGVISVFLLYAFLNSETLFLLILTIVPFIALINIFNRQIKQKKIFLLIYLFLLALGGFFLYGQIISDKYNLFDLINCRNIEKSPEGTTKIFCRDVERVKSYDNLVGRIDVTGSYIVSFDGWPNDHFNQRNTPFEYEEQGDKEWPTTDIRFLYGLVKEPKVLVVGSSAQGIIKSLKKITPPENIVAIEINPAVIKMMTSDFFGESGEAYKDLNPVYGNGLSFIKSSNEKFDMITFMNTHSVRNLGHQGPPDYLHTAESYNLFLDNLNEKGFLMFEERPESPNSRLSLYRMIITVWQTLKKRGAENPSEHFVIWSWMGDGGENREYKKYSLHYYVSILVSKNPIDSGLLNPWIDNKISESKVFHLDYFKGQSKSREFADLFKMLKKNDFSRLGKEFDSSISDNNRPFLSQADLKNNNLDKIILNIGIICLVLWIIFTVFLFFKKRKQGLILNIYFLLIGFAFFFIEIILFQVYQNIFLSPSLSFVFILGFLLLSSGLGGYFSERFETKKSIVFLIPAVLLVIYLPDYLLKLKFPLLFVEFISLILISSAGFLMGFYFPKGLALAKKIGLKKKVYYFFAINGLAACFAAPLALYLGIRIGYIYTIIIALIFYLSASLLLGLKKI